MMHTTTHRSVLLCQDFAVQQLERRINRMQGERSNEEKIQLEAKIKDLTDELDQKNNTHTLLTLQLKRLQVIKTVYFTFDIIRVA